MPIGKICTQQNALRGSGGFLSLGGVTLVALAAFALISAHYGQTNALANLKERAWALAGGGAASLALGLALLCLARNKPKPPSLPQPRDPAPIRLQPNPPQLPGKPIRPEPIMPKVELDSAPSPLPSSLLLPSQTGSVWRELSVSTSRTGNATAQTNPHTERFSSYQVNHQSSFELIPPELLIIVFSCLDMESLISCSLVCRKWLIVSGLRGSIFPVLRRNGLPPCPAEIPPRVWATGLYSEFYNKNARDCVQAFLPPGKKAQYRQVSAFIFPGTSGPRIYPGSATLFYSTSSTIQNIYDTDSSEHRNINLRCGYYAQRLRQDFQPNLRTFAISADNAWLGVYHQGELKIFNLKTFTREPAFRHQLSRHEFINKREDTQLPNLLFGQEQKLFTACSVNAEFDTLIQIDAARQIEECHHTFDAPINGFELSDDRLTSLVLSGNSLYVLDNNEFTIKRQFENQNHLNFNSDWLCLPFTLCNFKTGQTLHRPSSLQDATLRHVTRRSFVFMNDTQCSIWSSSQRGLVCKVFSNIAPRKCDFLNDLGCITQKGFRLKGSDCSAISIIDLKTGGLVKQEIFPPYFQIEKVVILNRKIIAVYAYKSGDKNRLFLFTTRNLSLINSINIGYPPGDGRWDFCPLSCCRLLIDSCILDFSLRIEDEDPPVSDSLAIRASDA